MYPLPPDNYVKVGPWNTRYWTAGADGPVILLVHGLGGSVENWMANIGPLSQHHRVYAMDLPGFGRTDKTPLTRSLYDLVDFIPEFMDTLDIEKASLAGNSLGGGLILQFAAQHPARTEKLVLVDNAGLGREVRLDLRLCVVPLLGEWLTRPSRDAVASLWRKIVYDPALVTDELVDMSYDLYCLPGTKKALLATMRAGINICGQRGKLLRELQRNLRAITAPALITWGRQDGIIPLKHAETGRKLLVRSQVYVFDECGHMPQFEHPDRFNEVVLNFLASGD
jgi:pimeloyl-ACP methyl ester carboxylesterase